MFRLNRNERSHWSGNGVHVESELVFMIGRNMHMEHQHKLTDRVKGVSALFILGLILHTARRHGNGR